MSAAVSVLLNRWARHRAKRAIYTAVSLFRFKHCMALHALIEVLAGVSWHLFFFAVPTNRAGNNRGCRFFFH